MWREMTDPSGAVVRVAAPLLLLGVFACGGTTMVQGECRDVYGAQVCGFSEMQGDRVVSFGATVPLAAIEAAPAEAEMVWPPVAAAALPLGEPVASATGFRSMTIYWEAHGHPPGAYLTPHFDFHFYTAPAARIAAIDCVDTTKPTALPAGYVLSDIEIPGIGVLTGTCVPKMGMHALPESASAATTPFEHAMVVGYDKGDPIFLEPMVSRAALMAQKSFSLDVPKVAGVRDGVHYPATFRADYDSTAKSYRFTFTMAPGSKATTN